MRLLVLAVAAVLLFAVPASSQDAQEPQASAPEIEYVLQRVTFPPLPEQTESTTLEVAWFKSIEHNPSCFEEDEDELLHGCEITSQLVSVPDDGTKALLEKLTLAGVNVPPQRLKAVMAEAVRKARAIGGVALVIADAELWWDDEKKTDELKVSFFLSVYHPRKGYAHVFGGLTGAEKIPVANLFELDSYVVLNQET